MAKFTVTFASDGSISKVLNFMEEELICRRTAFIDGKARYLDPDICTQIKEKYSLNNSLLDLIYKAFDELDASSADDAIVALTKIEERLQEDNP